jgi:hypothetical protein
LNITSKLLAVAAAGVFCGFVFFVLSLLSPTLVTMYAERKAPATVELEAMPYIKYAAGIGQVAVPVIRIYAPAELRGSDGGRLSITIRKTLLDHGNVFPGFQKGNPMDQSTKTDQPANIDTSEVERPFIANLVVAEGLAVSPADRRIEMSFKDAETLSESPLSWHWTITAKSLGLHTILVQGLPLGEFSNELESPPPTAKILSDGTPELEIRALTPLGLTAFWDAILTAIKGVVSVFLAILALPWFARFFDALARMAEMSYPPCFRWKALPSGPAA